MRAQGAGAQKSKASGRIWFNVHSWIGLKLSVLLAVVLVSGTLAVWRDQIDWLVFPAMRVTPGPERVGLDVMRSALIKAYPDLVFLAGLSTGADRDTIAVGVIGATPALGVRIFWVDQYSGVVTGDTPYFSPGYALGQLHANLFIPMAGDAIVTSISFLLLGSLVTGLVVYKRFWRGFLRRPRGRDLRTLLGDLHRLVGLWSLWFLAVMIATGLWYFWTLVAVPQFGAPSPPVETPAPTLSAAQMPASAAAAARRITLDGAVRLAQEHRPGFTAMYVDPPKTNSDVYSVHGTSGELLAPYHSVIHLNPYTGAILSEDLAQNAPVLARVGYAVTPLHFGSWGGPGSNWILVSKAIWFVFGAGLSFLAFSGVLIYGRRLSKQVRPAAGPLRRIGMALSPHDRTLGWLKVPSLVLVLAASAGAVAAYGFMSTPSAAFSQALPVRDLEGVSVAPVLTPGPGGRSDVLGVGARPYLLVPNLDMLRGRFRSVMVCVVHEDAAAPQCLPLEGTGNIGSTRLFPMKQGERTLQIRATAWDGSESIAQWHL